MNSDQPTIQGFISKAAARLKLAAFFFGLSWWLAMCLGVWLLFFVLDNLLSLPAGLRFPLTLAGMAVIGVGFAAKVFRTLAARANPKRTAAELELEYRIPENLLINACDFESRDLAPQERVFAEETIRMSAREAGQIQMHDLWHWRRLSGWAGAAALLALLWVLYMAVFPRYATNALARYVRPLQDVPPVGSAILTITPAENVIIGEGESLEVTARCESLEKYGAACPPPAIVWQEQSRFVEPVKTSGHNSPMLSQARNEYSYKFSDARRPFAFRVFAGDTYSRSVYVDVRPIPKIIESTFRLTPPDYTGLKVRSTPGPPGTASALPGSKLETRLVLDRPVQRLVWQTAERTNEFRLARKACTLETFIAAETVYEIWASEAGMKGPALLARGQISLEADKTPEVDFMTDNRNRFVTPGAKLTLPVEARDDFGVRRIAVALSQPDHPETAPGLKTWSYLGPPGNPGPIKETLTVEIDPARFIPGETYVLEASAEDFCPGNKAGKSRPIVLRVRSIDELTVTADDALAAAFARLKQTAALQEAANRLTENLQANLDEAVEKKTTPDHQKNLIEKQEATRTEGGRALAEFRKVNGAETHASRLAPLVEGEMPLVTNSASRITRTAAAALPELLSGIKQRQSYILGELMSLLGKVAESRKGPTNTVNAVKVDDVALPASPEGTGKELKEDLKDFIAMQKRIIERSKSMLAQTPENLTAEEERILGELAREEAKWAAFLEDKLTDFSKLPQQDFADGSMSKEFNSVLQEIKKAAKSLYDKKVEIAVPQEQSGLENAEEIVNNLEKWLPDTPDNIKWLMEEPLKPADIALAELPSEMEDIAGDLLDKEEEMGEDVEDVTSSWLDSVDKGAGWDAMDGPISSMSAKGVTGNRLPNQEEIGGRSGEGRNGRSHGQMVGDTAEGKGGRETPTRLTPSPFEPGSVKDSSTKSPGGATGGGKLSGFAGEGLRGPAPPEMLQKMKRLANQQADIRQQAEALALKLRAYHLPSGDMELAVNGMQRLENDARKGYGAGVRQAYSRVVDTLKEARDAVHVETGLHREQGKLPAWMRDEVTSGLQDGIPPGYEDMAAEYFRILAEEMAPAKGEPHRSDASDR